MNSKCKVREEISGQKSLIRFKMNLFRYSFLLFFLISCTLENIEDSNKNPKTDFSSYNYILATEDASTPDITRFFSFNPGEVNPDISYDLIHQNQIFENSDPSTSSGHHFFKNYIFSMAKDKKGYSSTPGIYRLTLNTSNHLFIDNEIYLGKENLFPSRKLSILDSHTGFFYNESLGPQTIQKFNPTTMQLLESMDLKPHIREFRPEARFEDDYGNNLVRTGSLVLDYIQDKLLVSVVFLEEAAFNLISEEETSFYLAVIDIPSFSFEKIISYPKAKTVGFFVSENNPTTKDEDGTIYFCSWGWNQFYSHSPSRVFRIKNGETDFDPGWEIDIEALFGKDRIAQSIISFNNKIYLHVSEEPYLFDSSEEMETKNNLKMYFYEFDPETPDQYKKLDIPASNPSSRINVFTVVDNKLFMAVPNAVEGNFNGVYSLDKTGTLKKELTVENKYRPTRFYKLTD